MAAQETFFNYGDSLSSKRLCETFGITSGIGPISGFGSAKVIDSGGIKQLVIYPYASGDQNSISAKEEDVIKEVDKYMEEHLSMDAYLVWEALNHQPPYIRKRLHGERVTNRLLAEFFDLPKSRNSVKYISKLRDEVHHWMKQASKDIKL